MEEKNQIFPDFFLPDFFPDFFPPDFFFQIFFPRFFFLLQSAVIL